jgi:ABC-type multidrug transport system fused ATPase/permease subunit
LLKPFFRSLRLLSTRQKSIYVALTLSRGFANFLDVLGLAAVGLLGAMLASGLRDRTEAEFLGFSITIESSQTYFQIVLIIAGFFISKSLVSIILLWLTTAFLARVEAAAAIEVAEYLFSGNLGRLKRFSRGDLQFGINQSSKSAMFSLLVSGAAVFTELSLFLAIAIAFIYVDAATALFVAAYFVILIGSFQLAINQRLKRIGLSLRASTIGVVDSIQDLSVAFRELVVFSKRDFFLAKLGKFRRREAKQSGKQMFLFGLPRFLVETGLMLGLLGLIAWQFWRDNTAETIIPTAIFLAGGVRMMAALLPLQNAIANIKSLAPQAELAQSLIEEARVAGSQSPVATEEQGVMRATSVLEGSGCDVVLRDVYFTHHDATNPVIRGVTMAVPAGGYVALVGPSGAGKTTLADLILGIHQPDSGVIELDGNTPAQLRATHPGQVAYVPQAPGLVSGTIAQNVALGIPEPEIDEQRVWEVLDQAALLDFVRGLPLGIHNDLGKQADSLSGGQKQRLGLARALYPSPSLLVLDEATSALDAATEAGISETISRLGLATSVIVIAHRLSTIQYADRVFVIEEGNVSAEGTFAEVRAEVPLIEEFVRLMSFEAS